MSSVPLKRVGGVGRAATIVAILFVVMARQLTSRHRSLTGEARV